MKLDEYVKQTLVDNAKGVAEMTIVFKISTPSSSQCLALGSIPLNERMKVI